MQSLSELNNISNTTITYIDERPSGVNLTYTPITYYNQLDISSTTVLVNQIVDIDEIIKPETANVRYRVEIKTERSPALSGSSIGFATLPSGVTLSTSGSVYTLNGITTVAQWELIKNFTWNLPSNYASCPFWYLEVSIVYFDSDLNLDQSYTWLEFDTRFYYFARMESTVVLRVPFISDNVGTTKQFDLEMLTNFTIEAKTTKSGSVDLYSNFTIVCNIGENPKDVIMNSTFDFSCNASYGYDYTPTYPSIELGNIRCRSYIDTEFSFDLLPTYKFSPYINLSSAFSPTIICRWVLLSPVRPTANLISTFIPMIHSSYKYRYTAALSAISTMFAIGTTDHTYNITTARTFNKNIGTLIFASNTPYLESAFPSASYKIEFICTSGYLTWEDITSPSQLVSSTGSYLTINSKFANVKYYPVKNATTSTTITFKKYRDNVLLQTINFNLSYSGTVGVVETTLTSFTTSTFNYSIPLNAYYYGSVSYAIVGAGGGGSGSLYNYTGSVGTCVSGNGGWAGSILINNNQIINTSLKTNVINGTVGNGGAGSSSSTQSVTLTGFPTSYTFNSLTWNSITVNSSGLFVAVGSDQYSTGKPTYSTSTDGVTWTTPGFMNNSTAIAYMQSVTVNSSGLFVAVGYNSTNYGIYAVSNNGTTWTTPTLMNNNTGGIIRSVAVNSSGLFVAVGNIGSLGCYAISTNGTTWTTPTSMGITNLTLNSVTVNSSGLFVAVGCNGNNYPIYTTSTNGTTWTTPSLMNNYSQNGIMNSITVNSSGLFVAVGYGSPTSGTQAYYTTSTNGTTWTTPAAMPSSTNAFMQSVTVNLSGLFVAVGDSGLDTGGKYSISFDGTIWTVPALMTGTDTMYTTYFKSIAVNSSGLFVAVGRNGHSASTVVSSMPIRNAAVNGQSSSITFSDSTNYLATGGRGSINSTLNTISYKLDNIEQISQSIGQENDFYKNQYGRGLDLSNTTDGSTIQYSIIETVDGIYEVGHGGDKGQSSIANSNPTALTVNTVTSDLRISPATHTYTLDYNIPGSGGYGGGFIQNNNGGSVYTLQDGGSGRNGLVIFASHMIGAKITKSILNSKFNLSATII